MDEATQQLILDQITATIKVVVNGKIDKMNVRLDEAIIRREKDMARVLPVLEAFEGSERALALAGKSGRVMLWVASFIVALFVH